MVLTDCLFVALGGGLGALSRYGVSNLGILDHDKYIYTLVINMTGCLIIGILWALFQHYEVDKRWYLFAITGILGGYTTFSAFSLDAMLLVEAKEWVKVTGYIAATYIGGLLFCFGGLYFTQRLLR